LAALLSLTIFVPQTVPFVMIGMFVFQEYSLRKNMSIIDQNFDSMIKDDEKLFGNQKIMLKNMSVLKQTIEKKSDTKIKWDENTDE